MKPTDLNLTQYPQLSKLGRPYRLSAIMKNLDVPSKWFDRVEHWHLYYVFMYTDDNSLFGFEFNYSDDFVRKLSHEDCKELFIYEN
jgi:hypothetical protein